MRRGGWGNVRVDCGMKNGGSDASVSVLNGCMGFSKIVIASAVVGWVERSETHQCFREDDGFRYALPILPTKHDFAPSRRNGDRETTWPRRRAVRWDASHSANQLVRNRRRRRRYPSRLYARAARRWGSQGLNPSYAVP